MLFRPAKRTGGDAERAVTGERETLAARAPARRRMTKCTQAATPATVHSLGGAGDGHYASAKLNKQREKTWQRRAKKGLQVVKISRKLVSLPPRSGASWRDEKLGETATPPLAAYDLLIRHIKALILCFLTIP